MKDARDSIFSSRYLSFFSSPRILTLASCERERERGGGREVEREREREKGEGGRKREETFSRIQKLKNKKSATGRINDSTEREEENKYLEGRRKSLL